MLSKEAINEQATEVEFERRLRARQEGGIGESIRGGALVSDSPAPSPVRETQAVSIKRLSTRDQQRSKFDGRLTDLRGLPGGPKVRNVLTIDLEDWPVAVLGPHHDISVRVVANTKRVLQLLRWHQVRATFFVLTRVAEKFPDLIRMVHDDGHEIASHGHSHELVTRQSPGEFAHDVAKSIDVLRNITGRRPIGYRAPAFSVVRETRWAGTILESLGFEYDSSVFPIRHPRYGIADSRREIHAWDSGNLIECPPATIRVLGRNLPIAGGGYFRLMPGIVARSCIRSLNRRGTPAILYMHPYEIDTGGLNIHKRDGIRFGPWRHLTQGLFRNRIESRLHKLLESFEFATMREILSDRATNIVRQTDIPSNSVRLVR